MKSKHNSDNPTIARFGQDNGNFIMLYQHDDKDVTNDEPRDQNDVTNDEPSNQNVTTDNPIISCEQCQKIFSLKHNLAAHIRTFHTGGENPTYICKKCEAVFETPNTTI